MARDAAAARSPTSIEAANYGSSVGRAVPTFPAPRAFSATSAWNMVVSLTLAAVTTGISGVRTSPAPRARSQVRPPPPPRAGRPQPLGDTGRPAGDPGPVAEVPVGDAQGGHDRLLGEAEPLADQPAGEHPMLP